jgi:hypothetical protein
MKFPDALTVVVRDRDTRMLVDNVAIVLVLFAKQKNNYTVGPLISAKNGQVEFSRTECELAIRRAQEMFIMDYQGDLDSCRPIIDVRLHRPEHIKGMLQQYQAAPDFWGQAFPNSRNLFSELRKVKNADYEPARITATEAELATTPRIEIELARRDRPSKTGSAG